MNFILRQINNKAARGATKIFHLSLFIFHLMLLPVFAAAQTTSRQVTLEKQYIPHLPVDTLPTDRADFKLVTYTDNTFKFVPTDPVKFRDPAVYGRCWDTVNLFVYRSIELKDLPSCIDIKLIDGIGQYHCPAKGYVVSKYGPRGKRDHQGVDIKVEHGDPIYSAFDGIVRLSKWNSGGYGNLVIVRHPNGLETYYGHLSRRNVAAGDYVRAGQVVGYGGKTGRAYGVHLHFEARYCDQTFDPERLIDVASGNLRFQTFALEKSYFNNNSREIEGIDEDSMDMGTLLASAERNGQSVSDTIMESIEKKEKEEAAKAAEKAAVKYHTIRSGDTLLAIARKYGTTVPTICQLNGITRDTTLKLGKSLRVQ